MVSLEIADSRGLKELISLKIQGGEVKTKPSNGGIDISGVAQKPRVFIMDQAPDKLTGCVLFNMSALAM